MELDNKKYQELAKYIEDLDYKPTELIAILHRAQHLFGYLPREVQEFIADKLNINVSKVYGVVTFYSFFTMEKKGKYVINICMGTACFVRGADKILKEFEEKLGIKNGETTPDGKFTLSTLRCVGACGLAPVVQVNGKTYGNATLETVTEILEEYSKEEE
jgi:NADH-quinone oxidoreductase subunit E